MSCQNQNIQVFVRCRPINPQERRSVVEVVPTRREVKVNERNTAEAKSFFFDQVFGPEACQIDVYKTVVRPLIDQVLLGFNCTVFAYGQTGTGKTYTMEGDRSDLEMSWEDDPHCGVIPRAISQLFESLKDHDNEFTVRVSFIELYNEDTYDLLSPLNDTTKLKVFEDAHKKGSVIVGNLEEIIVQSKAEIFDILKRGSAKRQTAATLLNACSSRSHTIFSVTVHIKEGSVEDEELLKIGKLNLVDLAGSENIGRSGAQDKRAREAGNINQSLLTLGRVITALVEKRPHIPYRESKLTRLLQDSLGGKTKTSIIATISPALIDLDDTLSTLDYATRAKKITNKPEMNQRLAKKTLLREYAQEIERLRKDLQATREKSGVYIDEDNYKEMCKQLSAGNSAVREKEERMAAMEAEVEKSRKLFEEFSIQYQQTKAELAKAKEHCEEQMRIINAQKEMEARLSNQAAELLQVAEKAASDNTLLHGKRERIESILKENRASINQFHPKVRDDITGIESLIDLYTQDFVTELSRHEEVVNRKLQDQIISIEERSLAVKTFIKDLKNQSIDSLRYAEQLESMAHAARKQSIEFNIKIDHFSKQADELDAQAENLKKSQEVLQCLDKMRNIASTMQSTCKRECTSLRQKTDRLFLREIKEDVATGTTPQKRVYEIPKHLL